MKWLKGLLVVIAALAALVFGGGLLLSPQFTVVRSVTVQAEPATVYALVADPRHWKDWSAWNQRDPAMQLEYFGAAEGVGSGWAWRSESQGQGRMSFTVAEPGRHLAYDLYFPDYDSRSTGDFVFAPAPSGTQVTWTMHGDAGDSVLMRWMGLFADRMIGPDFETGLTNLKALAESR